jgi:hypothetical protein
VNSQDFASVYVPLPKEELTVEGYFQLIEKSTGYKLTYNSEIIESKTINLNTDSLSIKAILDTLFVNKNVRYILKGNLLILSPQNEKANKKNAIRVTGNVKSSRTSKPVPFASVFVPQESVGTISNYEGAFELYIPDTLDADTIMVSCIGYTSAIISSDEYLIKPIEVNLHPNKYEISELVVRPENPRELIERALANKSENYSNKPMLLTAFFREATKQNNSYISLSEAIIDIYKTSYSIESEDLVKLKKGRKGSNTEESELVNMVVEGGLYNSMQLDVVKYGVSFLDPEQMSNYEYTMDKQISYGGRQTYVIRFNFNPDKNFVGFDGTLYLDAKSLAIVRAEFEISDAGLLYAKEMMVKRAPSGFQVKPKFGKYEVEYRMYNDCWNLMHGRSDIGVKVKKLRGSKNKGYTCQFTSASEFVVTGQETEGFERIKYKEASKPKDILYEQISSTDLEFWDNETIILPEEPLMQTIEKLKLNEKNDKAKLTTIKSSGK